MQANTHHIRACRTAWIQHQANCRACQTYDFAQCPTLGAEFHEVCAAILANRECEHLTAEEQFDSPLRYTQLTRSDTDEN